MLVASLVVALVVLVLALDWVRDRRTARAMRSGRPSVGRGRGRARGRGDLSRRQHEQQVESQVQGRHTGGGRY